MKSVNRKRYTPEFKGQAVGLVGLGKPVPEVAEELGIGSGILYAWVNFPTNLKLLCFPHSSAARVLVLKRKMEISLERGK